MIVIRNTVIPFSGFKAINLFGLLFVKKNAVINDVSFNHERIHTSQMKEMLYVFFYIWYIIEWCIKLMVYWDAHCAYRNMGFEREAYLHEDNLQYLKGRRHFSWIKYLWI